MKITSTQIVSAYEVAKRVYESNGTLSQIDGINELVQVHGMNESSARVYVRVFDHLMRGDSFKRTINAKSFQYYLEHIFLDYGSGKLSLVLSSLREHIDYFENVQQTNMRSVRKIYESFFARIPRFSKDEMEQQEIEQYTKSNQDKQQIISDLQNLKETDPEQVVINRKVYKRDNKTVAQLKVLRDFKCQLCDTEILKKDGSKYIEAAHIKAKHRQGRESPSNLLIVCPNHHKEFDFGDVLIKEHTPHKIQFSMNGANYNVDLSLK